MFLQSVLVDSPFNQLILVVGYHLTSGNSIHCTLMMNYRISARDKLGDVTFGIVIIRFQDDDVNFFEQVEGLCHVVTALTY